MHKQILNKRVLNTAVAVLMSLGVAACSSGGSGAQPGISVEENRQKIAVTTIETNKTSAQEHLDKAEQALADAKAALAEVLSTDSAGEIFDISAKINDALTTVTTAVAEIAYIASSTPSYVSSASKISSTAESDVQQIAEMKAKVDAIYTEITEIQAQANNAFDVAIEKDKLAKAEAEEAARIASVETAVNAQLTTAQAQLTQAKQALAAAQNATSSVEALKAAAEAQQAANNALTAANEAAKKATEASNSTTIAQLAQQAQEAATAAQTAANQANTVASELLAKEEGIAREEAAKIAKANSDAAVARQNAEAQLTEATSISNGITTATNTATSATSAKAVQAALAPVATSLESLKTAATSAQAAADTAKNAAAISSAATADATVAQAAADQLQTLVSQAEANLTKANEALNVRVAREKEATTAASYNREDSIVQDYLDQTKREALLAQVQKTGTNAPASCANSKSSTCHKDVERGSVVVNYNQAYSSYAVLRETYDADGVNPTNSFVALAKESDLTTDRAAVTNATYTGKASYSRTNGPAVLTRDFTLTVNDDKVSGSVYQTTVNSKGVSKTTEFVGLKEGNISVNNGVVGFNGVADFSQHNAGLGTYKGVFVGSKAGEVVGTFETDSTEKATSIQGAFAGAK
ncbi:hypothetical protein DDU33_02070 [Actinobacillus porcitonsillarum]|uniref:Transferrin-binding protein B C-lobe/N-lobe beta barrel domain-containing protein n=1 Tax=Actinobacillus porcitonsillarum TaxID=189834 RepID=A0A2U8FHC3_9PAST|nr:hypothetical protein [Actinobacillus porcitonsillarum]AWI50353.1 hypothetical protein DDU33_02070 [Actinobacillus porcitonsillarum]